MPRVCPPQLAPERLKCYEAAARAASEAALQRTRRVRTALNLWAAERYLSAEQLTAILGTLHYESDRVRRGGLMEHCGRLGNQPSECRTCKAPCQAHGRQACLIRC